MPNDVSSIKGVEFYGEWKAIKKPRHLARHKNPGLEIVLVSKGEFKWVVENKEVQLRPNTLFYTLPWQEHGGIDEAHPSCEISYLCLKMAKKYAKPQSRFRFHSAFGFTSPEEKTLSSALTGCTRAIPADSEAAWLFAHFFKLTRKTGSLWQSRARDTIKLIVSYLADAAASQQNMDSETVEAEGRVRKFTQLLAARHAEPWTLSSMGHACRLGRTQFSQILKKQTGDTPVIYLNRLRLREAQRLLGKSTKSITEIAFAVGFNSSQYFATVFKDFTGVDAGTFRARS